jgi:hypothetical protein
MDRLFRRYRLIIGSFIAYFIGSRCGLFSSGFVAGNITAAQRDLRWDWRRVTCADWGLIGVE